jgi:metal-sulfur cluster biosynthetic enzyme
VNRQRYYNLKNARGPALETDLTKRVTASLNELVDEETTRRFGELNIVTEVSDDGKGSVMIKFRPLSAYSPLAVDIGREIRRAALSTDGIQEVRVECAGHMMDELVNRLVNGEKSSKPK